VTGALGGRVPFVTGGRGRTARGVGERFLRESAYVFAGDLTKLDGLWNETDRSDVLRLDVSPKRVPSSTLH
jgi:NAD(P)-dependent dehydrogenase (short-subunit alcohol dehydrogenase family)